QNVNTLPRRKKSNPTAGGCEGEFSNRFGGMGKLYKGEPLRRVWPRSRRVVTGGDPNPVPAGGESNRTHGEIVVGRRACEGGVANRGRLRTAPIRSRERQRADGQLLMTFCLGTVWSWSLSDSPQRGALENLFTRILRLHVRPPRG